MTLCIQIDILRKNRNISVSQGDFGCYGGAFALGAKTPNIGQFADESLLLTNYKWAQLEEKFMEVKF